MHYVLCKVIMEIKYGCMFLLMNFRCMVSPKKTICHLISVCYYFQRISLIFVAVNILQEVI